MLMADDCEASNEIKIHGLWLRERDTQIFGCPTATESMSKLAAADGTTFEMKIYANVNQFAVRKVCPHLVKRTCPGTEKNTKSRLLGGLPN